jgi:hypothetical protein
LESGIRPCGDFSSARIYDGTQSGRNGIVDAVWRHRPIIQVALDHGRGQFPCEWQATSEQLVENDADGVEIGGPGGFPTPYPLGVEVVNRADDPGGVMSSAPRQAMPKSVTCAIPPGLSKTFPGFRSQ